MSKLTAYLDRLFFPVLSPVRLAVVRICTGLFAAYYLYTSGEYLVRSAGGAKETFAPVGLACLLSEPIDPDIYQALVSTCTALSLTFTAGFWFRLTGPLFAVGLLFILSYSNSWSMVFHTENMLVLQVMLLGFTPSAAALSFDSWEEKSNSPSEVSWFSSLTSIFVARAEATPRWIYGWSIVMIQLAATLPYVVAGLAKVMGKAGVAWALGHSLRDQITMNGIYYEMLMGGTEEITFHVYGYETAFLVAASMTLVLELGAPFAILHRHLGYLFVAGLMGMHWSIWILMGIPFRYQMYGVAFACFFPWEDLPKLQALWLAAKNRIFGARPRESEG